MNHETPRAMIHKRIIDAAAEQPNASLETIANTVTGASTDLVERVLDEYGDPADTNPNTTPSPSANPDQPPATTQPETSPSTDEPADTQPTPPSIELSELTPKRRETLRAIYERPDASQRELADQLGVTAATISQRVNAIDNFNWTERAELVEPLFTDQTPNTDTTEITHSSPEEPTQQPSSAPATDTTKTTASDGGTTNMAMNEDALADLHDRLHTIEEKLEQQTTQKDAALTDPELAAKVIHACMDSETLTTDEELELIKSLLE